MRVLTSNLSETMSRGVRDFRSYKKGEMTHMFSMLVIKSRVSSAGLPISGCCSDFQSLQPTDFLPTASVKYAP